MSKPIVQVIGDPAANQVKVVRAAAQLAGADVSLGRSMDEVADWAEDRTARPIAVALPLGQSTAGATAIGLRSRFPTVAMPIIGISDDVTDLAFADAYAAGMDDVCVADARLIGRRLRFLAEFEPQDVPRSEQSIVVADSDSNTRQLVGRVFRDAGYRVDFASDAQEALRRSLEQNVRVVVCSSKLDESGADGVPLSTRVPESGSKAAWIINTPPKDIPAVRARLRLPKDVKVYVHDAFESAATLLFVANELVNQPAVEARKSERLLYGTVVKFRDAGRDNPDTGYLYNFSSGGMYVRTLAAPERGAELWLEFVPPRSDRLVHLEGSAVWARRFGIGAVATVPCGFGVQLTDGSKRDMDSYEASYQTFLAERTAQRALSLSPSDA